MAQLTVFYDGACPLCAREMAHLKKRDVAGRLQLEDLHAPDFSERYPHIDPVAADKILHGQTADGKIITGLDVTCLAWRLVGKGYWVAPLRWPLVRHLADAVYLLFARYRHSLSRWLGRAPPCDRCNPGSR